MILGRWRTPRTRAHRRFTAAAFAASRITNSVPSHLPPTRRSLAPTATFRATIRLFPRFVGNSTGHRSQLAAVSPHTFQDGQLAEAVAVQEAQRLAPLAVAQRPLARHAAYAPLEEVLAAV